jgi:hypothetical protein
MGKFLVDRPFRIVIVDAAEPPEAQLTKDGVEGMSPSFVIESERPSVPRLGDYGGARDF